MSVVKCNRLLCLSKLKKNSRPIAAYSNTPTTMHELYRTTPSVLKRMQHSLSEKSDNFKFDQKLLIFMSLNRFSMKIYYMINQIMLILQHKS
jgi:hypothetical protein